MNLLENLLFYGIWIAVVVTSFMLGYFFGYFASREK